MQKNTKVLDNNNNEPLYFQMFDLLCLSDVALIICPSTVLLRRRGGAAQIVSQKRQDAAGMVLLVRALWLAKVFH